MRNNKFLNAIAKLIVIILFVMMLSIFARVGATILVYKGHSNTITNLLNIRNENSLDNMNNVNWEKRYPFILNNNNNFDGINISTPMNNIEIIVTSTFQKYKSDIEKIKSHINNFCTQHIIKYNSITKMGKALLSFLNWKINTPNEYNSILYLQNDYLATIHNKSEINDKLQSIETFYKDLETQSIPFIYIQSPGKVDKTTKTINNEQIEGKLSFSNINADEFIEGLKNKNIPYLDLREIIENKKMDNNSLFFKTDHHWKPKSSLWATSIIGKRLNDKYNFNMDLSIWNEQNYIDTLFEDSYLGSQGKKITIANCELDDFIIPIPKKNYQLELTIPSENLFKETGSFSVLINPKLYKSFTNGGDYYHALGYGTTALFQVHNNTISEGKKILLLGDSFNDPLKIYLSLGVKELTQIDLRHFTGSLKKFLQENRFDLIILNLSPGAIEGEALSEDHTSLFDFR